MFFINQVINLKKLLALLFSLIMLTSCGQSTEIQYQAFAIGLGIDFKDNQYIVYMQYLDFSNVAQFEGDSINTKKPVWLAVGKGKTIHDALIEIYQAMQIQSNFEHLTLFIFTEDAIKYRLQNIIESLNSIYSMRINGWVYGTDGDIGTIFTAKMPFYYPHTDSQLNHPETIQQSVADIPPISAEELIIAVEEKTKTLIMPKVVMNPKTINIDTSNMPVVQLDGGFFIKGYELQGEIDREPMVGFIKMNNDTKRTLTHVKYSDDETPVTAEIRNPKVKRSVIVKNGVPRYHLSVDISLILREHAQKKNQKQLHYLLRENLKEEIFQSISSARNKNADIYQFEDYLFRYKNKLWAQKLHHDMLNNMTIDDIDIKIREVKSSNKIGKNEGKREH